MRNDFLQVFSRYLKSVIWCDLSVGHSKLFAGLGLLFWCCSPWLVQRREWTRALEVLSHGAVQAFRILETPNKTMYHMWVVFSFTFLLFISFWEWSSQLTNILEKGWNQQQEYTVLTALIAVGFESRNHPKGTEEDFLEQGWVRAYVCIIWLQGSNVVNLRKLNLFPLLTSNTFGAHTT